MDLLSLWISCPAALWKCYLISLLIIEEALQNNRKTSTRKYAMKPSQLKVGITQREPDFSPSTQQVLFTVTNFCKYIFALFL